MKAFIPAESIHTSLLSVILVCCLIQKTRAQKLAEIPFNLHENVIFFKATLNGSHELNFMFDSGAGITVVNSSVASELDLHYTGESVISTGGRKVTAKTSTGNSLQIDKIRLEDLSLEILNLDHLSEYFNTPVEGIIGYDLFSQYITGIQADDRVLQIHHSLEGVDLSEWKETALIKLGNNKVAISTGMKSRDGRYQNYILTLDTGAPDQIHLSPKTLEDPNLELKIMNKRVRGFSADTTITENLRGKLKGVSLAGKSWKNVQAIIPLDPVTIKAFGPDSSHGFIGQELLLDFNMIYDYKNKRFYLQERN
jgi:hypothetical protein